MMGLKMHIDSTALDVVYSGQSRGPLGTFGAVACPVPPDPTNWHLFCHKPGLAKVAHEQLNNQGFKTFNPKLVTKIVVEGRVANHTLVDLFGHYHFVQFDAEEDCGWSKVHFTFGVRRLLLSTSLKPATMPADAMERLLASPVLYEDGIRGGAPSLVGKSIRVLDGPWTSFFGEIESTLTGRVIALMSIFGRSTRVELPLNSFQVV